MKITCGPLSYEWQSNWGIIDSTDNWAHHDMAMSRSGDIYSGHPALNKIMILDSEGNLKGEFELPITESHGLCLATVNGVETLWLADIGTKYNTDSSETKVIQASLSGEVLQTILKKDLNPSEEDFFCPTGISINERNGDVWIADGYGSSKVFVLNQNGELRFTLDGTDGAGRFNCPHGVLVDPREAHSTVWIADRANNRIQIYDLEGNYQRTIGEEWMDTPSGLSLFDDTLVVAELNARLLLLDSNYECMGEIGNGKQYLNKESWPNRLDEHAEVISPVEDIQEGKFNSPHGVVADAQGNIYVSEWLRGSRFTKLKRC